MIYTVIADQLVSVEAGKRALLRARLIAKGKKRGLLQFANPEINNHLINIELFVPSGSVLNQSCPHIKASLVSGVRELRY